MSLVMAGVVGALFGAGLLVSGMTQPAKVIGFLDVAGGWDPSLAFVMGGAVVVYGLAWRLVRARRREPWFDAAFHLPTRRDLDARLLGGAAIFGVGWGLGGLCPGPGLVAAGGGATTGLAFVAAMLVGLLAQRRFARG
ncbi:MAG: YeeE/YedE family protein [Kofleriaceae bacterium]|nr:YeeE/YedE family protein [Kofleriaceae bacterium]